MIVALLIVNRFIIVGKIMLTLHYILKISFGDDIKRTDL